MLDIIHYGIIVFFAVVCLGGAVYMAHNMDEF